MTHRPRFRPSHRQWLSIAAALTLGLVAASCGDDGDSTSAPVSDPVGATTPGTTTMLDDEVPDEQVPDEELRDDESEATTEPQDVDGPSDVVGAVVTIGDERFELPDELVCVALGGAVGGTFADDSGVQVTIDVPPEDWQTSSTGSWEAPSIVLRDERDDLNYRVFEAGMDPGEMYPDTEAEDAQIDTFVVAGDAARGSGTVIDTFAIQRANVDGTGFPELVPFSFEVACS